MTDKSPAKTPSKKKAAAGTAGGGTQRTLLGASPSKPSTSGEQEINYNTLLDVNVEISQLLPWS